MKTLISLFCASALLWAVPVQAQDSLDSNPGYINFTQYISVSADESVVEVQVKGPLLKLAASIVEAQEPDVAELIRSVQLVRVHVYEVNDENREQFAESVQAIAQTLEKKNWEQLVKVRDGKENVAVYANMPTDEAIAGLVVSVSEGSEAVFVNIVGDVALDSIAELGKQLNIPALDKLSEKFEEG